MSRRNGSTGDAFTACHSIGHAWYEIEAERNPAVGWYMKMRCERCGTERNDIIDRYGQLNGRNYKYQKGYQSKPGEGLTRSEWRVQFLKTLHQ